METDHQIEKKKLPQTAYGLKTFNLLRRHLKSFQILWVSSIVVNKLECFFKSVDKCLNSMLIGPKRQSNVFKGKTVDYK